MKNARPITPEMIAAFKAGYDADKEARVLTAAASHSPLGKAAMDPMAAARLENSFSVEVKTRGITAQQKSGRCWLFASMNVMREIVAEKCNLEKFELSGNWLGFWDKFEKINFFLESVLDCTELPVADRTLDWVLNGISDGGQWDMMVSIVKKYGIVPASVMPETAQSCNTAELMRLLNTKLRKDAIELRALAAAGGDTAARKDEMLAELFKALCICFGRPVDHFDFAYTDKDGVYHVDRGMTPVSFYEKYIGLALEDYVSVIHAPTADKPFGKTYTVKYLGNVVEGRVRHLNLPMEELKALAVAQLKAGEPVWFGSDCGKFGNRDDGIWDPDSFVYGELLGGLDLGLTKAERLDYRDSAMNHAMVLCGVNLDENGRPDRWKIENSWGETAGRKGYFVASDSWFDQFVYQAVVHKRFLSDEQRQALSAEPIELAPWDPMGSLA